MRVALSGWRGQQNRAVLVLAIFTLERHISEFLTLPAHSGEIDSQRLQIGSKLNRRLQLKASHAKTLGGLDIGCNVINVDGLLGLDFESAKSLAENKRVGLAGTIG